MKTAQRHLKAIAMTAGVVLVMLLGSQTALATYGDSSPLTVPYARARRRPPTHYDTLRDLRLRGPMIRTSMAAPRIRSGRIVLARRVIPVRVYERRVIERRRPSY